MSFKRVQGTAIAAGLLFAASVAAFAQPTPGQATQAAAVKPLPFVGPIFADNMVPQRGKPDTIWGWSDPGDTTTLVIIATSRQNGRCNTGVSPFNVNQVPQVERRSVRRCPAREDCPGIEVNVLYPHAVEFAGVAHSGVAHYHDDVLQRLVGQC